MTTRNKVSKQVGSAAVTAAFAGAVALVAALAAASALAQQATPPAPAQTQVQVPAAQAPAPAVSTAQPAAPPAAPVTTPGFPPQPAPPAQAASGTPPQRGLFNNFGQWWDQSIADFKAKWHEQQNKLDTINKQHADAAKDAAAATSQAMKSAADAMRFSHIVEVQEKCPLAGNGAADCESAAVKACKAKGFKAGQPLDVRTAEKCSDSLWVSGRTQTAADCPDETVILRVACQ